MLRLANEEVNRIQAELESLEREIRHISSTPKAQTQTTGAEMQFDEERCEILASRCAEAAGRLSIAKERRSAAMTEFQKVWQRREVLDVLREHERQAYIIEESRREQRAQDDLFLQRRKKR